ITNSEKYCLGSKGKKQNKPHKNNDTKRERSVFNNLDHFFLSFGPNIPDTIERMLDNDKKRTGGKEEDANGQQTLHHILSFHEIVRNYTLQYFRTGGPNQLFNLTKYFGRGGLLSHKQAKSKDNHDQNGRNGKDREKSQRSRQHDGIILTKITDRSA